MWCICGLLSFLDAIIYAEVITILLRDGGYYMQIYEVYGQFLSFFHIWVSVFMATPAALYSMGLLSAQYLLSMWFPECHSPLAANVLTALVIVCKYMLKSILS